jgi:flagellin
VSVVQIAEGAQDEVTTIIQRLRDLAVQGANSSLSATERSFLETEADKLLQSMTQAAGMAEFSGNELLLGDTGTTDTDGSAIAFSGVFQVGPNEGDTVTIETVRCHPDSLFPGAAQEKVEFTLTDAQAGALTTTETVTIAGQTVTLDLSKMADNTDLTDKTGLVARLNEINTAPVNAISWSVVGDTVVGIYDNGGSVASDVNKMGAFEGAVIQQGTPTGADADAVLDFSTQAGCQTAITTIQAAYDKVAKNRAQLGAVQAQMESTIRNLANVVENTTAARSRIQDADFAAETAALTRAQMLQQAATSILAQANAQPQSVLELIRN